MVSSSRCAVSRRGRARHRWIPPNRENPVPWTSWDAAVERERLAELLAAPGCAFACWRARRGSGSRACWRTWRARAADRMVLTGRATEYESDLPFGPWREALEPHLAGLGDRRVALLGLEDPEAVAAIPGTAARRRRPPPPAPRAPRPAGAAGGDAPAADLPRRRPLGGPGHGRRARRPDRPPARRAASCSPSPRARTSCPARSPAPGHPARPLTAAEAAELVGEAAAAIYDASGGNPFYLEQLARRRGPVPPTSPRRSRPSSPRSPRRRAGAARRRRGRRRPVRARPRRGGRRARRSAPGAGRAAARRARPADGRAAAVRVPAPDRAPCGLRGAPGGWRLGAHARAAEALRRRGAGPVALAHHVEHAAAPGDTEAIALLLRAGEELRATAPATRRASSRPRCGSSRRTGGGALAARRRPGRRGRSRRRARDAAGGARRRGRRAARADRGGGERRWALGRNDDALRRLQVALAQLPAEPSPDRIRLRLALTMTALEARALADAEGHASDARADARAIGDRVFEAAALASGTLALADRAVTRSARWRSRPAALEPSRPPSSPRACPRCGCTPARAGGSATTRARWPTSSAPRRSPSAPAARTSSSSSPLETAETLIELGRLEEALAAAREARERARLAGHPGRLVWALPTIAAVHAPHRRPGARARPRGRRPRRRPGPPGRGRRLAARRGAGHAGPARRGRGRASPRPSPTSSPPTARPRTPTSSRSSRRGSRRGCARRARPPARSAVLLARGDAPAAVVAAREAAAGSPMAAARARLAEGRALAAAGDRPRRSRRCSPPTRRSRGSARCGGATRPCGSCAGSGIASCGRPRRATGR